MSGSTGIATTAAIENYRRYSRARDAGHKKFIERSLQCENFVFGDQWSPQDKAKLDAAGRPAVTVNLCLPTVNGAVGELSRNEVDFRYKPKKNGATADIAHCMTRLAMHINESNKYYALEKDMIRDAVIAGRGYIDVRVGFTENLLGEIEYELLSPREVVLDPTAREYDPRTWNEVFITRWMSLDEISAVYGEDKAKKLQHYANANELINDDTVRWEERSNFGDETSSHHSDTMETAETGRTLRQVRVIERQFYKLNRQLEFVDPVTGELRPVPDHWSPEKAELLADARGYVIRPRLQRRIRWTVSADCVELHDGWSPYRTFTVVPLFCYFLRGRPFGMIENLISPQEIVNKAESQKLHIVNTTANSGWIVDSGALLNMTVEELEQRGAETGLVLEKASDKNIEKITPNSVPTGITEIGRASALFMREISGVNGAMLGVDAGDRSGVALENQQMRGSIQLQPILDNLKRTREILGRKILECVQLYYTEERVYDITHRDGTSEQLAVNQTNAAGELVNDLTIGEYELVVSQMPARDTYEETQFAQALSLREAGIFIPDHVLILLSSIENKQDVAELVKQMTGFGELTEEQQMIQQIQLQTLQTELQKLQGEVENVYADAEQKRAKAYSEGEKPAIEREKMQTELAIVGEEQAARLTVQRLKELSAQIMKMQEVQQKQRSERMKLLEQSRNAQRTKENEQSR